MRFYATTKLMRILVAALWGGVAVFTLVLALHEHRWSLSAALCMTAFTAQTAAMWSNYWEVTPVALVQHAILYRRNIRWEDVTYAGPVRARRLKRWLRKSIELDAQGLPAAFYVAVVDRSAFLRAVREQAVQAEIVLPESSTSC